MRCPKCRYISVERGERCRNCGYDFSLSVAAEEAELPLRAGQEEEVLGPMADLALDDRHATLTDDLRQPLPHDTFDRHRVPDARLDMPLFGGEDLDRPLVSPAAVPRPPLAVRRSSMPEPVRYGSGVPRAGAPVVAPRLVLDPEFEHESADGDDEDPVLSSGRPGRPVGLSDPPVLEPAGAVRRTAASAIDLGILLSIDCAVLYFTLRLCGLEFDGLRVIPPVPFVGFLLLLNGGYTTAFTAASGQTIGKMAAGIKVVGVHSTDPAEQERIGFGSAVLRTVAYLASALPAGLGFVPAFVGRDRRALHDRLAETRVIRVSAIGHRVIG
jgi:uncharacterized RDD family membrane protein YckC